MSTPVREAPTRNSLTTIRSDGSRPFLFPADPRGRFTTARRWSALALIATYLSLPWIRINGQPAVFLDVADRRFHLFGATLAAEDLWLLFFVITGVGFSLFFLTSLLGRVWCGWACPHTVFLDHVYRRIERWIDGNALKRRALANAPLSPGKIFKRVLKHTLYVLVSAVITHLFLAYFVSLPEVWAMVSAAPTEHWGAFGFIVVATGLLYFNFAWFREQMCIVICPYGRMQSAMIDDHSLVIGYDAKRGEPRGKGRVAAPVNDFLREITAAGASAPDASCNLLGYTTAVAGAPAATSRNGRGASGGSGGTSSAGSIAMAEAAPAGDCVVCNRCVQVCPTGIDIRHGLQMECIGCTACIDACDDVMTRLGRPRGLIRYDSQAAFTGGRTRWLRPRTLLYGVLLLIGAAVATRALLTVTPANFAVTRMTGAPYIVTEETVRNQFLVRIVNKRTEPVRFQVRIHGAPAGVQQIGLDAAVDVAPFGEVVQPLVVQLPRRAYEGKFKFDVSVAEAAGAFRLEREVEFLGPDARLLREEERAQP